jgi:hypothetical protein
LAIRPWITKLISIALTQKAAAMKQVPKPTTDEDLIQAFLDKGGEVKKGKTKPMPDGLGLSNNQWGNTLTKEEKAARKSLEEARKASTPNRS